MRQFVSLLIVFCCAVSVQAQSDSVFAIELVVTASVQATQYEEIPTAQSIDKRFTGSAFLGRLIWRPNHLLGVGLQSGYITFSNEELSIPGNTNIPTVNVVLTAIPIHMVLSMNPGDFDFGVGIGGYVLQSRWRLDEAPRVNSSDVEYGIHSWIGYEFTIADQFTMGPELSLHVLSNRGIASLAAGVRIRYNVASY